MYRLICPRCERKFEATRSDARYCGHACRAAARRSRVRRAATRDARVRDLLRLHTAVMEEGIALRSVDAVVPELDLIADEIHDLLALGARS